MCEESYFGSNCMLRNPNIYNVALTSLTRFIGINASFQIILCDVTGKMISNINSLIPTINSALNTQ